MRTMAFRCEYCHAPMNKEWCSECGREGDCEYYISLLMTNKKPISNNYSYLPALSKEDYCSVIGGLEEHERFKG